MKLVIASDIHGSAYWCRKLMEVVEQEKPDKLILLGDLLYHGPRNDLPRDYAPKQVIPMLCVHRDVVSDGIVFHRSSFDFVDCIIDYTIHSHFDALGFSRNSRTAVGTNVKAYDDGVGSRCKHNV